MKGDKSGILLRYKRDFEFRTVINTTCSSIFSAAIGAYHLLIALLFTFDIWSYTLAGYYLSLAFARVAVLISHKIGRQNNENESKTAIRNAKNYLACGGLLVLLTLAFSGVIVLTVVRGEHAEYVGYFIFGVAFYAFWKISMALYNLIKASKKSNLTIQAFRSINIADALVSLVSLQSALLAAFPHDNVNVELFNAVTGGIAGVLILALGTFMIVRGNKKINELENEIKVIGDR